MLRRIASSSVLACLLTAAPRASAAPTLPLPSQALLEQFKGEWVIFDQELGYMTTRVDLQADGRGTLVNESGASEITWRLDAGQIKINLLKPTLSYGVIYEPDADGNSVEYTQVTALQSLNL